MTQLETCKGCTDEQTPEPGPVLFKIKPDKPGHQDTAWTCEKHVALTVRAFKCTCLVTPVRIDSE